MSAVDFMYLAHRAMASAYEELRQRHLDEFHRIYSELLERSLISPSDIDGAPDFERIVMVVAAITRTPLNDLYGSSREKHLVQPRQFAMWATRTFTNLSFPQLGDRFDRDHTTIMHAWRKVEDKVIAGDAATIGLIERLKEHLETRPAVAA